jgi:hypothetical protein
VTYFVQKVKQIQYEQQKKEIDNLIISDIASELLEKTKISGGKITKNRRKDNLILLIVRHLVENK